MLFVATYSLTKEDAMLLTCRTTSIERRSGEIDAGAFDIISTTPGVPDIGAILSTPVLVELTGGGFDILIAAKSSGKVRTPLTATAQKSYSPAGATTGQRRQQNQQHQ